MSETTDSLIMEGLKVAIVEAFFKQQQYYTPSGSTYTYGGTAAELVKKVLESAQFKTLLHSFASNFEERKTEFQAMVQKAVEQKAKEELIKYLNNTGNQYELRDAIRRSIQDDGRAIIEQAVKADPKIQKLIASKVGKGEWDIQITVSVNATQKSE